jgi:hypothetical protein
MPPDGLSGGAGLEAYLKGIAEGAASAREVRVGFLEGSTYPDGTSIPEIAAIQEFGGRIEREPSEVTLYRKVLKNGEFSKNGQFVKKEKSNFATDHYVGAYVITIPARPFFRNMIAQCSSEWGEKLGGLMTQKKYDAAKALALMGQAIEGQLRDSITEMVDPPNAKSTIAAKGFDKPLVNTGVMRQSVDSEVI